MAPEGQIELFLKDFKYKLGFWGLLIRSDRDKNFITLTELEYSMEDVKNELRGLAIEDYAEDPVTETSYKGADMWVFGKTIQSKEIYIKITMGRPSDKVLCISFHFAKEPLTYPNKKKKP